MKTKLAGSFDPVVVIGDGQEQDRRRVLYIEDNPSNLKLVAWILDRESNVELISATRGARGIELARQHHPDLIVLDLHLPDMPGERVLESLQADLVTHGIPVVVLSADSSEKRIRRLLQLGARDYLVKPFDIPHFLEVIAANVAVV